MSDERAVTFDEVRAATPLAVARRVSRASPAPILPARVASRPIAPRSTDARTFLSPLRPPQSYRVRVLDSEKFNKARQLSSSAHDFCDKVAQLDDIVKTVVEAVDQQARVEREIRPPHRLTVSTVPFSPRRPERDAHLPPTRR